MTAPLLCRACETDPATGRQLRVDPETEAAAVTELIFCTWGRGQFRQYCPNGKTPCPHGCKGDDGQPNTTIFSTTLNKLIGGEGKARSPFHVIVGLNGAHTFVVSDLSTCHVSGCPGKQQTYRHSDARVLRQLHADYINEYPVYPASAAAGHKHKAVVHCELVDSLECNTAMGQGEGNVASALVQMRSKRHTRFRRQYAEKARRWYQGLAKLVADDIWSELTEPVQLERASERAEWLWAAGLGDKVEQDTLVARAWENSLSEDGLAALLSSSYMDQSETNKTDILRELQSVGADGLLSFDIMHKQGNKVEPGKVSATLMNRHKEVCHLVWVCYIEIVCTHRTL